MAIEIVDWDKYYENNRTRGLKQMQWVPIPNRHDGDGYTELVNHPNGAGHLGIWLALIQVASRCAPRGTLLRDTAVPHDAESLSRMTRLPVALWKETLPRLISIGWIRNNSVPQEGATIPQDDAEKCPLNGMEWNGKNGMETVSTPVAPTRHTESVPKVFYDFAKSLWYGIPDEQVSLWGEAYPAVDVELELRQMGEWCKTNGAKGKKQNWSRFIVNWLKRQQDKGGSLQPKGMKR